MTRPPRRQTYLVATQGALVVWDPCGCGGYCGFEWFDKADVARMVAAGPPDIRHTKRSQGNVSEWVADDGTRLLMAWVDVRWGDMLA